MGCVGGVEGSAGGAVLPRPLASIDAMSFAATAAAGARARVPAARRRKHVVVPRFPVAAGPMVGAAAGEQLSFFSELA